VQHDMRNNHLDLRQLYHLVRIVGVCFRKLGLPTSTGRGLDLDDLRRRQQDLAMPRMSRLRSWSPIRGRGNRLLRKRRIGRWGTIGVAGVLGYASFECSDACFLLLDDREQMDDPLAHDERGLFPTGGIDRKTCWKWKRSRHRIPFVSRH
jgi:hypothetical protein